MGVKVQHILGPQSHKVHVDGERAGAKLKLSVEYVDRVVAGELDVLMLEATDAMRKAVRRK